MGYFFAVVSLFYITYRLGKEDGKWGCFTVLVLIFLIGAIGALFNK